MGRPKKTETIQDPEILTPQIEEESNLEPQIEEKAAEAEHPEPQQEEPQLPANVIKLMRLYSFYEEMWITPKGFVHPVGAPKYLIKGATLYKNKYYNK